MKSSTRKVASGQFPLLASYFPKFQAFLASAICPSGGQFDFIVPIETKGAMLLDALCSEEPDGLFIPSVLYPRGFDFLADSDLVGKTCAVVDDTLYSGRTMRQVKERLARRGLKVSTFAFVVDDTPAGKGDRDENLRSSTNGCVSLVDPDVYRQYLTELKLWTVNHRVPASHDHLVFEIGRLRIEDVARVLSFFSDRGSTVLSYGGRGSHHAWAVFAGEVERGLGGMASWEAAVPAKFRLWQEKTTGQVMVVPMWCPAEVRAGPDGTGLSGIIRSRTHNPEDESLDRMDAAAISGRLLMMRSIYEALPESRGRAQLQRRHLDRYFTPRIADVIEEAASRTVPMTEPGSGHRSMPDRAIDESVNCVPYRELARTIARDLKVLYENQDVPRFLRKQIGRTVAELLRASGAAATSVHAAIDYLVDFGYASAFWDFGVSGPPLRKIRSAELPFESGIDKLAVSFVVLSEDKTINSTEAEKLIPMYKAFFGGDFEGHSVYEGPGGYMTGVVAVDGGDNEDVVKHLGTNKWLRPIRGAAGFELAQDAYSQDVFVKDADVSGSFGQMQALVWLLRGAELTVGPADRAVLMSTLGARDRGLSLLWRDAAIISEQVINWMGNYRQTRLGGMEEEGRDKYIAAIGLAYADAMKKLELLSAAREHIGALRGQKQATSPFIATALNALQVPDRWDDLLFLWGLYLKRMSEDCRRMMRETADGKPEATIVAQFKSRWWREEDTRFNSIEGTLRDVASCWRIALSGRDMGRSPAQLDQLEPQGEAYYAHYDLAGSSKQVTDRKEWLRYAADMVASCAAVFGCKTANKFEMQAESGFIWSTRLDAVVSASTLATYVLYLMSEIRSQTLQAEWAPVFCVVEDVADGGGHIGNAMAAAAKTTKSQTRADADHVASKARELKPASPDKRVFVMGEKLIQSMERFGGGVLVDEAGLAARLGQKQLLASVRTSRYVRALFPASKEPGLG